RRLDEGHAEVRLRDGRGPRGDARFRHGRRSARNDGAIDRTGTRAEGRCDALETRGSEESEPPRAEERARHHQDLRRAARTRLARVHGTGKDEEVEGTEGVNNARP